MKQRYKIIYYINLFKYFSNLIIAFNSIFRPTLSVSQFLSLWPTKHQPTKAPPNLDCALNPIQSNPIQWASFSD